MHDPRPGRIGGIGLRVRERSGRRASARTEDHFGLAVAVDVLHQHQLTVGLRHDRVLRPTPALSGRIHVQEEGTVLAGDDVGPAVAREVEDEVETAAGKLIARIHGRPDIDLAA